MNCTRTALRLSVVLMLFVLVSRAEDATPKPDPELAYQTARADSLAAQLAAEQRNNKEHQLTILIQNGTIEYLKFQYLGDLRELESRRVATQRTLDEALKKACDAGVKLDQCPKPVQP